MILAKPAISSWLRVRRNQVKAGLCLLVFLLAYGVYLYLWRFQLGIDWHKTYYPATRLLLTGQDPYGVTTLHNPVWALLPLVPFALLGERLGSLAYLVFSLFTYAFVAYRLRAHLVALTAFLVSLPVLYAMGMQNVDTLVLWGYILPPPIGLFLLVIKPQMGIGMSLYWAYLAWRRGGWRKLAGTFAPVLLALALSFVVFGNWLAESSENLVGTRWNASLWPWSIPLGLGLLYFAIRYDKEKAAISSGPLLSPYLAAHSWAAALMGLLEMDLPMVAASAGIWLFYAIASMLYVH